MVLGACLRACEGLIGRGYNTPLRVPAPPSSSARCRLHIRQPRRLMRAIDRAATDDAVLTYDSGTIGTTAARHFGIRADRQFYLVNPDEPPMPGKVNYEQAKKFAKSFFSGQSRKATIATTLFKDKIRELRS